MPESIEDLDNIKDLVNSTWKKDPKERPSAMHVRQTLEKHFQGDKPIESPGTYNPFRCAISLHRDPSSNNHFSLY